MNSQLESTSSHSELTRLLNQESSESNKVHHGFLNRFWSLCWPSPSTDLEDNAIIEYRSPLSECWGRTWEYLNTIQTKVKECCSALLFPAQVCGIAAAVISCICCIATCALGAIYWTSYGVGVAFNEITFHQKYFGEIGDTPFARYFATPGIGFALLIAPIAFCALLCLAAASRRN